MCQTGTYLSINWLPSVCMKLLDVDNAINLASSYQQFNQLSNIHLISITSDHDEPIEAVSPSSFPFDHALESISGPQERDHVTDTLRLARRY